MKTSASKSLPATGLAIAVIGLSAIFSGSLNAQVLTNFEYTWAYDSSITNFAVTSPDPAKNPGSYRGNQNSQVTENPPKPWDLNFNNETFNLNVPQDSYRTYTLRRKTGTGDPLTITNNGLGSGVEIKAKVNAQYGASYAQVFSLFTDTGPHYQFVLGANRVGFVASADGADFVVPKTIAFDTTTAFNTYQLYLKYDSAQLYINGSLMIDGAGETTLGGTGRIEFGVLDPAQASGQGAGSVSYEHVKWGNNMSLVPEPSVTALLGIGILGCLLWTRRRHRTQSHASINA